MRVSNVIRRTLCMLLLAAMLAMTGASAFAASKPSGAYVVSNTHGERLIVHATASMYNNEVTRLKPGTVVVYKSTKNGWWKVQFYGGSGYVDRRYLTSVAYLPEAKYKAVKKIPVYYKNKTSSGRVGYLKTSLKVSITKQKGSWVHIKHGSKVGWVQSIYLRKVS